MITTNEEAIAWLDRHNLERLEGGGLRTKLKSIEALEKQIPKKPGKKGFEYFCPCCETCVGKNHIDGYKSRKHYCFNCGQAILWED